MRVMGNMRALLTNKKGNLEDWGLMAWLILTVIFSVFFTSLIIYNFNDKVQGMTTSNIADAQSIIQDTSTRAITLLDTGVLAIYLIMFLFVLISAYFIRSTIKLAIVGFLYIIVTIWMFPIITEIGLALLTANTVTTVVANLMPKSFWILNNLTKIQIVTWLLVMIMLYAKNKSTDEEAGVSGSI
jgi:hypothetical protein